MRKAATIKTDEHWNINFNFIGLFSNLNNDMGKT